MNIKISKEYEAANHLLSAINNYSFSPKVFAECIKEWHQTNQQDLYRLIKEMLKVMADESRTYDDRNRASHEEAKSIMDFLVKNGRAIPKI